MAKTVKVKEAKVKQVVKTETIVRRPLTAKVSYRQLSDEDLIEHLEERGVKMTKKMKADRELLVEAMMASEPANTVSLSD